MYKVISSSHADREFKKLTTDLQRRLAPKIKSLEQHPNLSNIKRLFGSKKNDWRLRIGDFRILYEVDDSERCIIVHSVCDRKDAY